jgi:hypothetical protein
MGKIVMECPQGTTSWGAGLGCGNRTRILKFAAIERFQINDSLNAQSLTPALSPGERVRTAELAVANSGKINKQCLWTTQ